MTDDTYTHRPGAVEEDRDTATADSDGTVDGEDRLQHDPAAPVERGQEEWNWRDWVLVGLIVVSFIVVPVMILVLPPVRPFRFAYIVLPLIPAIILGAVAVWSAQRSS